MFEPKERYAHPLSLIDLARTIFSLLSLQNTKLYFKKIKSRLRGKVSGLNLFSRENEITEKSHSFFY